MAIYAGALCDTIQEKSYFSNACGGWIVLALGGKPDTYLEYENINICLMNFTFEARLLAP
ncbi:hypothetical protein SBX64_06700 [Vibrio rhizosphaerae]|uniref:Uncharacterized protein n=1 Tax=Vibrio rhizosphaerae TaxID=398736 RepID=A0ABU4ISX0_9VIBR|nr:hypothetical protein [Vibrio rhizosphaerae]MDW6092233.1 hypothetical protein [Vibrio rhizosphaerae]